MRFKHTLVADRCGTPMATASVHDDPSAAGIARWPTHRLASFAGALAIVLVFPVFTGLDFLSFGPVPYFLAAFVALALVVALVAKTWAQRGAQVLLGLLGVVFVAGNAEHVFPELSHPEHFPDYGIAFIGLLASVTLVLAAVASFVPALKRSARVGSWGLAGLLVLAGIAAGGAATMYGAKGAPAVGAGSVAMSPDVTVEVTAKDDAFVPATINVPAGKIVKIHVVNADNTLHNLHADALGIGADLPAGKATDIWIKTDKTGTFQSWCALHSAAGADGTRTGMVGTIVVA